MRGQGAHELGEELGAGRAVGHLVEVVEDETHVERGQLAEGVEDAMHRITAVTVVG